MACPVKDNSLKFFPLTALTYGSYILINKSLVVINSILLRETYVRCSHGQIHIILPLQTS